MAKQDFKRPSHFDFMDSSELKKAEFSGMRNNSITGDIEIWILGEIRKRITQAEIRLNSNAVERAYAEVFALDSVKIGEPDAIKS